MLIYTHYIRFSPEDLKLLKTEMALRGCEGRQNWLGLQIKERNQTRTAPLLSAPVNHEFIPASIVDFICMHSPCLKGLRNAGLLTLVFQKRLMRRFSWVIALSIFKAWVHLAERNIYL